MLCHGHVTKKQRQITIKIYTISVRKEWHLSFCTILNKVINATIIIVGITVTKLSKFIANLNYWS